MKDRVILHCDCNSFYASCELLHHPELKESPVAVCGNPENRHGIILAKNDPAKKYGIQTAETIQQALRKCPNLILLPAHHDEYLSISKKVNSIYLRYTDQVEPFGIDESWLDITGSLSYFKKSGPQIADEIRSVVKKEIGITVSVGVSYNKVFAKLGSDYKKPDATTVFSREDMERLIFPLPADSLLFVGKSSSVKLARLGIRTIGDLARYNPEILRQHLGKWGDILHQYALGEDQDPVKPYGQREPLQSVGNGLTFKRDLRDEQDIRIALISLTDRVSSRLRKHGLMCSTLQILVRDSSFKDISKQRSLKSSTDLQSELFDAALSLITDIRSRQAAPIRMITVTALNLSDSISHIEQPSLFETEKDIEARKRRHQLESAVSQVRAKYGKSSLSQASLIKNDLGIDDISPHPSPEKNTEDQ